MQVIRDVIPCPALTLSEVGRQLNVELDLLYDAALPAVPPGSSRFEMVRHLGGQIFLYRDLEAESQAAKRLSSTGLTRGRMGRFTALGDHAYRFLLEHLPQLEDEGWQIEGLHRLRFYRILQGVPQLVGEILPRADPATGPARPESPFRRERPGARDFLLRLEVVWEEARLPANDVWAVLSAGRQVLSLEDGRVVFIPPEVRDALESLFTGLGRDRSGQLVVDPARVPFVASMLERAELVADPTWVRLATDLRGATEHAETAPASSFHGTLRPYQQQGLSWLILLRDQGLGGILADDMGLGKTVQVLALLTSSRASGLQGPSLVVAPTSVLQNWEAEAHRFAPGLRTLLLVGPNRRQLAPEIETTDLVITSYALMRRDLELHLRHTYRFVVLDEAQHIKNPAAQTTRAARRLKCHHRLALTGTPIENRLEELWSQFSFVLPSLLGTLDAFKMRYTLPILPGRERQRQEELRHRVRPFILRRLKEEVARDLPPRTEILLTCELTGAQRRLYQAVLGHSRQEVFSAIDQRGLERSRMTVLTALLRLRQIACDPRLVAQAEGLGPSAEAIRLECLRHPEVKAGKMLMFLEQIDEIVSGGHRVLVFSQFVRMLHLLREELEHLKIPFAYMDGQSPDRQGRVDRFNAGDVPVFLLSLKAGGTGLNLTGADYVIHFDPWWNPAVEAQATDRAHRIGQTRPVFSYKLIARDTLEERMLELQSQKRTLAAQILKMEGGGLRTLTRADLEFLFQDSAVEDEGEEREGDWMEPSSDGS